METEIIEDDWNPDPNSTDSILNKFIVNFTNQDIKRLNEEEENFEAEFINEAQEEQDQSEKEEDPLDADKDNLMFDLNLDDAINIKKQMKKENLYDPLLDDKDDEWARKSLGRNKTNSTVLNCPYCFTTVCYECQQHDTYSNQFRAISVRNCKVDCTKQVIPKGKRKICERNENKQNNGEEEYLEDLKEKFQLFFTVECAVCNTEIGVFEFEEKLYHFFHVIAGTG